MVSVRVGRREGSTLSGRSGVLLGTAVVAPAPPVDRESARPPASPFPSMTAWRHQVPVHSPLSAAALFAGARAAASRNGRASNAAARVTALLRECYEAQAVLLTDSGTTALTAAFLAI